MSVYDYSEDRSLFSLKFQTLCYTQSNGSFTKLNDEAETYFNLSNVIDLYHS